MYADDTSLNFASADLKHNVLYRVFAQRLLLHWTQLSKYDILYPLTDILICIYDSLVQPYFNYCSTVWGNCGSGLSEKLQKLQNPAALVLMCAYHDSNIG